MTFVSLYKLHYICSFQMNAIKSVYLPFILWILFMRDGGGLVVSPKKLRIIIFRSFSTVIVMLYCNILRTNLVIIYLTSNI